MYVKDRMTLNPFTVNIDTPINDALDIMETHDFHRLPVVDEDNRLIGLVTAGLIAEATPSKMTSLSIYELNYLLSKTTVKDVMIKDVIVISEKMFLEEAANIMKQHDVGCLVVIDDEFKVHGIITQNDIFSAFIDISGYNEDGTRYVIKMDKDAPGEFARVINYIAEMNVNIRNIAVYHTQRGVEVMLCTNGENSDSCKEHLEKQGYTITNVLRTYKRNNS